MLGALIPVFMFGYPIFVIWLYGKYPPRRAAMLAFLIAWMFLPNYTFAFPGLPEYDKTMAAVLSVFIALFLKDSRTLKSFRFHPLDLIILFWCLTPFIASVVNGLGAYDGFSVSKNYFSTWIGPYIIGRLYFTSWDGLREIVWGLFISALIYVPFCFLEIMLSPQMHRWVFGYHSHEFQQTIRPIGYRPMVFMQHGLMVGMWMAGGALSGLVLWRWGDHHPKILGFPFHYSVLAVCGTFVACQSFGALILLITAVGVLIVTRKTGKLLPFLLFIALPFIQIAGKISGLSGEGMVNLAAKFSEERAASLEFRNVNEVALVEKALEQPVFGWGGWGRSRIYNEKGEDISVTDSLWIILFGQTGYAGLVSFGLTLSVPLLLFLRRFPPETWEENIEVAVALPLVALVAIYLIDCTLNDMKSPIYIMIVGGITSVLLREVVEESESQESWEFASPIIRP
ncbi:MAG: hypothetical protein AAF357_00630, partial [Verrucomicrobiota bacterium]